MADKSRTAAKLYTRLLRYVTPYWRMFAFSLACMVVLAATQPAMSLTSAGRSGQISCRMTEAGDTQKTVTDPDSAPGKALELSEGAG